MLNKLELKYRAFPDKKAITLIFEAKNGDVELFILVDQEKAIVYIAVVRYLEIPPYHPRIGEIMRRLMELNWKLSLGKLEWDSSDGEARLSYAFTTEDGVGQRALGVAIGYLVSAADNHILELRTLVT
jgi:hypothetical protein